VIRRPPLATLCASLVAHGGVLALLFFLVSGESHPSVLFIDLEAIAERESPIAAERPDAAARGGSKSAAPGSTRRDSARPSAPPSASPQPAAPPAPVAPPPSSEPEPVRERAALPSPAEEPRQPEPAVAVVPARETAPDLVARRETSSSPAETRTNSGGATGDLIVSGVEQAGGRATAGAGTAGQNQGGAGGAGVAPSGPGGGAPGAEYGGYLATVRRRFLEALRYPPPARSRGLTGTVLLEVFIKPDGAIGGVSVASSSSHPMLDEAALEAMRSLAPQPFPKGLAPRPLRVRLPVVFDLQ